eukprot:10523410-Alexandrium_andersonii.AAC.1
MEISPPEFEPVGNKTNPDNPCYVGPNIKAIIQELGDEPGYSNTTESGCNGGNVEDRSTDDNAVVADV